MTPSELQDFLTTHVEDIFAFMDYEATLQSTDDFAHHLANYWFSNPEFDGQGYVFVHLGHDGSGGHFAAWIRGDERPTPIVFFGSEGGTGVLAASIERWPHILAHAPLISERHGRPSTVNEARSYRFDDDEEEEEVEQAEHALASYREAVEQNFGPTPPLQQLLVGLDTLNDAFRSWVESNLPS